MKQWSSCYLARVKVEGRTTLFYVCLKCKKPCDALSFNRLLVTSGTFDTSACGASSHPHTPPDPHR